MVDSHEQYRDPERLTSYVQHEYDNLVVWYKNSGALTKLQEAQARHLQLSLRASVDQNVGSPGIESILADVDPEQIVKVHHMEGVLGALHDRRIRWKSIEQELIGYTQQQAEGATVMHSVRVPVAHDMEGVVRSHDINLDIFNAWYFGLSVQLLMDDGELSRSRVMLNFAQMHDFRVIS